MLFFRFLQNRFVHWLASTAFLLLVYQAEAWLNSSSHIFLWYPIYLIGIIAVPVAFVFPMMWLFPQLNESRRNLAEAAKANTSVELASRSEFAARLSQKAGIEPETLMKLVAVVQRAYPNASPAEIERLALEAWDEKGRAAR